MQPQTLVNTIACACKSDVEWWYQVYIRLCVTGHRPSDILGNSLPPSLSLTLLLFYFSLGLRRPQRRASISRISSLPSDLLLLLPPPLATPFDRIIRRRSKGRPALPDAANEKNHGKGGGGGGGSILSCLQLERCQGSVPTFRRVRRKREKCFYFGISLKSISFQFTCF